MFLCFYIYYFYFLLIFNYPRAQRYLLLSDGTLQDEVHQSTESDRVTFLSRLLYVAIK